MANDCTYASPTSASPLSDGENKENQQEARVIGASGDDVEAKEAAADLEEGELLDDGEVDEKAEDSEIAEPIAPAAAVIPSLLDMKISPPRNGLLYRKAARWMRKPVGRRRRMPADDDNDNDDDDVEDDDDGQQWKSKKPKKRKNGSKEFKARITYVDHDRTEVDSDDADSNLAWPGFGTSRYHSGGKRSSRLLVTAESSGHARSVRSQYDSPPGLYDSPYASPPGPYDSPESDTEKEESTSEKVHMRHDGSSDVTAADSAEETNKQQLKRKLITADTEISASENSYEIYRNQTKQDKSSQSKYSADSPERGTRVKRRRLVDTPWDERPPCIFYLEGKCSKGLDCAFSHNGTRLKKPRLCRYYKSGHCNNKSRDCSYHHETWPCVQFHRDGSCTDGDQCRYSHQELCDETRPLLEKAEKAEKGAPDDATTDPQPQPKKKSLLGDYPVPELLPPMTNVHMSSADKERKKIPSLFDVQVRMSTSSNSSSSSASLSTTSSTPVASIRPLMPRGFPTKNTQPGILGPGPAVPPRLALRLMRMRLMPPVTFPFADVQRFPFDPSVMPLPPTESAEVLNAAGGLPTNNVAVMPRFTGDSLPTPVSASTDDLAVAEATSQVGIPSSVPLPLTVPQLLPTCNTSSIVPPPALTSIAPSSFTSVGVSGMISATAETPTVWQLPQPSVIAGVDLSQLPPLQRQLFLRIHQQNEATAHPPAAASHNPAPFQTSVAVIPPLAVAVNAVKPAEPTVEQMNATTHEQPNSIVNMLKNFVQQPPPAAIPATVPRLPIAPMFDINQVLSAITQTVPPAATATGASTNEVASWQQESTKTDAELEVNGLRAEIVYVVQPIDCGGTVIPAYMDINDAKWEEDPRVQHWRREVQLGRMPRRETPKTMQSSVSANISTPHQWTARDPRLKSDAVASKSQYPQPNLQPTSTVSQLQQQQQQIQQMVQQLMQHSTLTSTSNTAAAVVPAGGPVSASAPLPLTAINSVINTSQFLQLPHPTGSVNLQSETSLPQNSALSVPSLFSSVDSLVAGDTSRHDTLVSSHEVPSSLLPSTTNDVPEPFRVPAASTSDKPPSAVIKNKTELVLTNEKESNSTGEQRKIDYNDPRFKKRKAKSSHLVRDSSKSASAVSDSKPSTCESVRTETGLQDRNVLQFQSPLAAADNTRLSTASSGYNRPPNKRYQELLEQAGQPASRDRYAGSTDPRRKPGSAASSLQLEKTSSTHPALSVVTYPGIVLQDVLSSDSLAKGSLKDMFKTIDPTASPFC